MEVSKSQCVLQKVILQHQRVALFAYAVMVGIQPPPTGAHCVQCSLFYRKRIFFSALVVTRRKGQIHFCLGFPDQSCLHSDNTTCTVKSPAFRTCQNYCVCIAVLLNTFQKAYDSEHAQGFWKCKPRSELLGPYSSVWFRIVTYSLVYLHFAYSEKN